MDFLKELGRLVAAAVVSYLLTGVVLQGLVSAIFGQYLGTDLVVEVTALLTAVLKALDRHLHETNSDNKLLGEKGLFGF